MKRGHARSGVIVLTFCFISFFTAQLQAQEPLKKNAIKPGVGFEYFSRTIQWDENKYKSKLKSYLFSLNAEYKIQDVFSFSLLLGYSPSNFNGLVFRRLPFSTELETGGIGGFLFGGEISKSITSIGDFEISGLGQFVYYLGVKKEWEIEGLNVKGNVKGKPRWLRGLVGPVFVYRGLDYFSPYLYFNFNYLWGKFKMDEAVQDLKGSEDKKIQGKSLFGFSFGSTFKVTDNFSLKGEASVMPYKGGTDFGFMIKAACSFNSYGRKK